MTSAMSSAEKVELLVRERPDLLPLVWRIVVEGGEGYFDDVPQADLDELVKRGLLVRDDA
jgi:hypothetical protein